MVNKYIRKTSRPSWNEEVMRLAMEEAKKTSVYAAAKKYGLNLSTLQQHVKKGCPKKKLGRYKTMFSENQEEELFSLCQTESLQGITRKEFLKIAYKYAEARKIRNSFKNETAGVDWYIGFMKRHPGLTLKRSRPTGGCYKVDTFCDLLEEKMKLEEGAKRADEASGQHENPMFVEVVLKREVDETGQEKPGIVEVTVKREVHETDRDETSGIVEVVVKREVDEADQNEKSRIVSASGEKQLAKPQQPRQLIEFDVQPGPSSAVLEEPDDTDSDASCPTELEVGVITEETGVEDPLANINSHNQCRFCANINKNCIDASDKPYLNDNKTTIILNDLNVEIAFNNDKQKVCLDCDERLLEMFNFVKLVKNAQDALLNVSRDMEATETLVIKTECESPTPDDDNEIDNEDTKEGIIDSITIDETSFVNDNVFTHKKRKCDDTKRPISKKQKQPKIYDSKMTYENTNWIMNIKEEPIEIINDAYNLQTDTQKDRDTGPDIKPSELDLATNALLNEMASDAKR